MGWGSADDVSALDDGELDDIADDVVGVTSARLMAAGVTRNQRLQAMRLLGVFSAVADIDLRVRRDVVDLAGEFDLPVTDALRSLELLVGVGAVAHRGTSLVLAGAEPAARGGLRLDDFLQIAAGAYADDAPIRLATRRRIAAPVGAVLAAAALVMAVLLAPGALDRSPTQPAASERALPEAETETATTSAPAEATPTTTATDPLNQPAAPVSQPVVAPAPPTAPARPCPAGVPELQVGGIAAALDSTLTVEGIARNVTTSPLQIDAFTVSVQVADRTTTVPAIASPVVIAPGASVRWQAPLPVATPPDTPVTVDLQNWRWTDPSLDATCRTVRPAK